MLPRWSSGKASTCQCRRGWFDPWVGKMPWRRKWQPTPAFLPGKFHGQRSLVDYSPWGRKELGHDSEWACVHVHTHFESLNPWKVALRVFLEQLVHSLWEPGWARRIGLSKHKGSVLWMLLLLTEAGILLHWLQVPPSLAEAMSLGLKSPMPFPPFFLSSLWEPDIKD